MRQKAVLRETGAVAALHLLSNLLLLVPVWVTGGRQPVPLAHSILSAFKVWERHLTIDPVIGSFQKEKEALATVTLLSWLLPTIVVTSSLVDLGLATVYSLWAHPWAEILAEVGKTQDSRTP
jgi:hydrogenase-4 membrane subunit HyfE